MKLVLESLDYSISILGSKIVFDCNETKTSREYSIPSLSYSSLVEYKEEPMKYITIHYVDGPDTHDGDFLQIKLESSHEIVLDHFDKKGELVEEFGCWDFYDDPDANIPE
jgi:hypothetical protein